MAAFCVLHPSLARPHSTDFLPFASALSRQSSVMSENEWEADWLA